MISKKAILAIAVTSIVVLQGVYVLTSEAECDSDEGQQLRSQGDIDSNSILGVGILAGLIAIVGVIGEFKKTTGIF